MFESIWNDVQIEKRPSLNQNRKTDVAVIGAGLAGILIAYELKKYGKKVIVLEADRIGQGMTQNTTAKITSQHNIIYQDLIENFGIEKSWEYARYNELAIDEYEQIIEELHIDCDFKREDAYVYTLNDVTRLENEIEAARSLGIDAEFTTKTALPFAVAGAMKFPNQASFHPLKFLKAVAEQLEIYEKSTVQSRKGQHTLEVLVHEEGKEEKLWEVEAENIVIANHYPFEKLKGFYAARMYQERENIIAVHAPEALPYGMYIGADNTGYSFRKYKEYLIMAGQNHRPGVTLKQNSIEQLEDAAGHYYSGAEVCYRMANQDCITLDRVPYIGKYTSKMEHVYIATGFNKWGMSHSMVAALIMGEMICQGEEKKQSIYNPSRFDYQVCKEELKKHMATVIRHMSLQKLNVTQETSQKLEPGHGTVVVRHGKKVAVYCDEDGTFHSFSARCPHLGCVLTWNQEEKSWDCPCHGSRFDTKGQLINGPALRDIKE